MFEFHGAIGGDIALIQANVDYLHCPIAKETLAKPIATICICTKPCAPGKAVFMSLAKPALGYGDGEYR